MLDMTPHDIAVFWSYVTRQNGCWLWNAGKQKGYGRFSIKGKTYRCNRISYFLTKGAIEKGKVVCHTCDNPSCVNPDHLWLGSPKDNTRDMIEKGRIVRSRCKHFDSVSKYPGVSFRKEKKSKPWRARIMRNYQTIWTGNFDTEEEAHTARLKALKASS